MVDNSRCYVIPATGVGGRVMVSNSFGWQTCLACANMRVFDTWSGTVVGPTQADVYFWNDIGIADNTADGTAGVFYLNTGQARYWLYNCTGIARGAGYAFCPGNTPDLYTAKNCLGVAGTGQAFKTLTRWASISSSASNDTSVFTASSGALVDNSASVFPSQSFSFVSSASGDYHLAPSDTGARRRGLDLSAEPVVAFTDDIDGDFRPPGSNFWDLGADQIPAVVDAGTDGGLSDGGIADGGTTDGGTTTTDGGSVDDGGVPDAGAGDGGNEPRPGRYFVGCGCQGSGGSGLVLLTLAFALCGRRRRVAPSAPTNH